MTKPHAANMNRTHAALLAGGVIALGAVTARAAGLDLAAALVLLLPCAIVIVPARTAAEIVWTARRRGALAAVLLGAMRSAAEAGAALLAGAVLRWLAPAVEMDVATLHAASAACIDLRSTAVSTQHLGAQMLARRGTIATTLSARVLPAPVVAAHSAA